MPVGSGCGGGGVFGGMLKDMGGGAALAAALTVGGTVGVVGTAALQPSEIRLSSEDRELLRKGMSSEIRLSAEDRDLLRKGMSSEIRFADGDRDLMKNGIKGDIRISDPDKDLLRNGMRVAVDAASLQDAADRLKEAADRLDKSGLGSSITTLSQRIDALRVAVDRKDLTARVDLRPVTSEIERTNAHLNQLKELVGNGNPRRNVRGQEGGSR
jgi:hypothetical protein